MKKMSQLKQGIKIEAEHEDIIKYIRKKCGLGQCPSNKEIFKGIAKAHLKEDPKYYKKLKKAGL